MVSLRAGARSLPPGADRGDRGHRAGRRALTGDGSGTGRDGGPGRPLLVGLLVLLAVGGLVAGGLRLFASGDLPVVPAVAGGRDVPPPPQGWLELQPVGSFWSLPSDSEAAAIVHRSTWEPRPGNRRYNRTVPPALRLEPRDPAARAYDPRWNKYILGRVTGRFTGTTDEIFQWAAAKWGLPDNLIRTVAYQESGWRQSNSGDVVSDQSQCPPGYRAPCPVTFGIVGTKSTSWPGIFPWNRDSTAAAVDVLGGWLRGCYEGWVWWLRDHGSRAAGVYGPGDLWGCVGAWASGDWHAGPVDAAGHSYIERAELAYASRPWLEPRF